MRYSLSQKELFFMWRDINTCLNVQPFAYGTGCHFKAQRWFFRTNATPRFESAAILSCQTRWPLRRLHWSRSGMILPRSKSPTSSCESPSGLTIGQRRNIFIGVHVYILSGKNKFLASPNICTYTQATEACWVSVQSVEHQVHCSYRIMENWTVFGTAAW